MTSGGGDLKAYGPPKILEPGEVAFFLCADGASDAFAFTINIQVFEGPGGWLVPDGLAPGPLAAIGSLDVLQRAVIPQGQIFIKVDNGQTKYNTEISFVVSGKVNGPSNQEDFSIFATQTIFGKV